MSAKLRNALWFSILGLALAGCGNKGDLVLPDAPEAEAPAEASDGAPKAAPVPR